MSDFERASESRRRQLFDRFTPHVVVEAARLLTALAFATGWDGIGLLDDSAEMARLARLVAAEHWNDEFIEVVEVLLAEAIDSARETKAFEAMFGGGE